MAHGRNAARNGHHREYWSRRPGMRDAGWGRPYKIITHRLERRVEAPAAVAAGIDDWRADELNERSMED